MKSIKFTGPAFALLPFLRTLAFRYHGHESLMRRDIERRKNRRA